MKVKCPKCRSLCRVDETKIPATGIHGRCPKCEHRFFIKKEEIHDETAETPENTTCPNCQHERNLEDEKCPSCGIIFEKFERVYGSQKTGAWTERTDEPGNTHVVGKRHPTIMIVEDEISTSMELEEMLTENGYNVLGVSDSGEEAISMAQNLRPDMILMDIKLSGDLDGIEAATKIRSSLNIGSVFLTGHGKNELLDRAIEAKPLGYVMKPLNTIQILAALKVALSGRAREDNSDFMPGL